MWIAQWWWDMQEKLLSGATITHVILASDKTQLSQFSGDKQAWPVYISVGNICKAVHRQTSKRGMILLGYLPVTKLECLHKKARKGAGFQLFHFLMSILLEPLIAAGKNGVRMTCADQHIRMVYPILAVYIADFPKQCLIAGVQQSDCPICELTPMTVASPAMHHSGTWFIPSLEEYTWLGLHPIPKPFWAELPHTDIFSCLTPDLLHQLHKGVFKDHLVKRCLMHAGATEIDQRFQCMPDHPSLRHFKKGISTITQWTGREFKGMQRIFASHIMSTETLRRLQDALDTFHEHKEIFVRLGIRKHFRIPKIHMMEHDIALIRAKGTPDGFNTELSEGYRASNKKNYIKQMVSYLTCRDAIHKFTGFLVWTHAIPDSESNSNEADPPLHDQERVDRVHTTMMATRAPTWSIAKRAPWPKTPVRTLIKIHGAVDFVRALQAYLNDYVPKCCVTASVYDFMDIYKQITIDLPSPQRLTDETQLDTIRATPGHPNPGRKNPEPDHFDCVLVHEDGLAEDAGIKGYRAARVRALFRLPSWFECANSCIH
ncbi:hypothetical protein JB92DRAFT_3094189 [Gautieria morchelliformis]|nr:hypothetical protein JB92DRAFT_3094189 [Gautieria morchelliformis]